MKEDSQHGTRYLCLMHPGTARSPDDSKTMARQSTMKDKVNWDTVIVQVPAALTTSPGDGHFSGPFVGK